MYGRGLGEDFQGQAMTELSRDEITRRLTKAAAKWVFRPGSVVVSEIGLPYFRTDHYADGESALRADVLMVTWHALIRIVEVKSCRADFLADKKWWGYARHCDYLFFCSPRDAVKPKDVGSNVGLLWPQSDDMSHLEIVKRPRFIGLCELNTRFYLMRSLAFRQDRKALGYCQKCGKWGLLQPEARDVK